jgi:hypothetical protein
VQARRFIEPAPLLMRLLLESSILFSYMSRQQATQFEEIEGIGEISGPLESRASYDFSPTSEKW